MPQLNGKEVADAFKNYGLPDPTPAEIGMFEGLDYIGGGTAIANYVNTKTAQMKAEAENPLKLFLAEEKTRRSDFEAKANDLYGKLQETISAAPKLFGNLSPEQIQQYIAPITQAARSNSADLEGSFARRGITGSNIESSALADAARKYQENILATGLNLGMSTQQAQASAMQQRINQLFGASGQSSNLLGVGAGQLTADQMSNMQTITQLPAFLRAMAQQEFMFKKSQEPGKMSWVDDLGKFNEGLDNISGTIGGVTNILGKVVTPFAGAGGGSPDTLMAGKV